jgi:hypothetical protein
MKTSNKLLIGLAVLIFAIPLTAIVYDSTKYTNADPRLTERRRDTKFNEPTTGYTVTALPAFNSVAISDGQGYHFNLTLIHDTSHGIKVSDSYKDRFSFKINTQGELEVTVLKKPDNSNYRYVNLLIYAQGVEKVTVANISRLAIEGSSPSLTLFAKHVENIYLGSASEFKQFSVSTEAVNSITVNQSQVDRFTADLKNSDFRSNGTSFKKLSLSASGTSEITLNGNRPQNLATIDSLDLTTLGKANLTITDIQLKEVSGSLSDSTVVVKMPVMYLRKLVK